MSAQFDTPITLRKITPEPRPCFVCGRSFAPEGRFCSPHCRDAFDAGFPPYTHARVSSTEWRVVAGPAIPLIPDLPVRGDGHVVGCAGCQREFVSRGLRCCSADCERKYRERLEVDATLAEVGVESTAPPKRRCQVCCGPIPRWTKGGRATPKTAQFCSPKCSRKAKKLSGATEPKDAIGIAKKPPPNGHLPEHVN
jgi:hypothetical protein